jgi:hypothetical protein
MHGEVGPRALQEFVEALGENPEPVGDRSFGGGDHRPSATDARRAGRHSTSPYPVCRLPGSSPRMSI